MVGGVLRASAVCAAAALAACSPAPRPQAAEHRPPAEWRFNADQPPASARRALVTADDELAARVGLDVLRAGGNAIDAAVAVGFALAVTYPEAGNIGGGGFIVARLADGQEVALDFRETAPLGARRDMFIGPDGEVIASASLTGHLAAGVPGSVAGLYEAHRRFGTRPWSELLEPAIRLAEEGFPVNARFAHVIGGESARLARFPASAALFLPNGSPPAAGSTWRNPELAAVLRRIVRHGPAGFYRGETADLIVAEMLRGGGLITHEDLAAYRPVWRDPVVFSYRGHRVVSMPPPSSGGLTLARIALILEGYDLQRMGWNSAATLHLSAEAMRRAFAERNHFLGDPDFVPIPRDLFLSREDAARRRAGLRTDRATPSEHVTPAAGAVSESEQTTHLSIADPFGNIVAFTTTVNDLYGSAVAVTGAGFVLNNQMDDFTSRPGVPNLYGLVQGERNAIEPGKRMLSAMTPTLVFSPAGAPLLITGSRGGPRIITAVWQILSNVVDHGMEVSEAVRMPRIHHQHLPDELQYESGGLRAATADSLRALGHQVRTRGTVGTAPTIVQRAGVWAGMADPRGDGGAALGY
jgi:gamma-glutamyltranspeptidase / glutathione hydrolase